MSSFLKGITNQVEVHINVTVEGDLGKVTEVPFKATFRRPDVKEAKDIFARAQREETNDDEIIAEYLVGWRDLKGAEDQEVEFTPENVAEAMRHKEYRSAIVDSFMKLAMDKRVYEAALGKN